MEEAIAVTEEPSSREELLKKQAENAGLNTNKDAFKKIISNGKNESLANANINNENLGLGKILKEKIKKWKTNKVKN